MDPGSPDTTVSSSVCADWHPIGKQCTAYSNIIVGRPQTAVHCAPPAGHSSGSSAKARLAPRYQSIDFLGRRQRAFIASRAS